MYRPVDKFPDFPEMEKRILELWEDTRAFDKLKKRNKGKSRFSFLDGPITANNPMGVHHAWGRSLKDMYQRFHAMCGKELRYQNGFDCQGLWVEVEVEKEHEFKTKHDIEEYGIDKFVDDCKARVKRFSRIQTDQSIRLGYWMDWNNSYYTMSEENNYTIWNFLKRCHNRNLVKRGFDAMPWCPRCGVGLSEMEMHEGYKWVEHKSVFLRFPLKGRQNESLLVWTTTPWTLTSNVAAAVNPDMNYYKIKLGDRILYAGADNWESKRSVEVERTRSAGKRKEEVKLRSLAQHVGGDAQVVGTLKGRELLGWEYEGPFDDLEAQGQPGGYPHRNQDLAGLTGTSCHKVIPWSDVTGREGSGIVHIAPGCGKEDYMLSPEHDLVAISPLDESGRFLPAFGKFAGIYAHDATDEIIRDLKEKQILVSTEKYPHRYAHCWRCGTPILYRLVDEWFIDMSWRDEIAKTVPQIRWIPEYGRQRELDWLENMGNWMISKKRYWGLALPIWVCDSHSSTDPEKRCDWFTVIGGKEELKEKAISGFDEFDGHSPHRPWIDNVKIKCERCGGTASRITDVGNPWLDAGIVPYSTMGWNSNREEWRKWFPADLVLECFPGQFRNWFYALLAMNTMMQDEKWADRTAGDSLVLPPFKTLLGHALVFDEQGREMHKSLGNAIEFNKAAEVIGAEVMRYIFASQNPTTNLRFPDIRENRKKNVVHQDQEVKRILLTLWNCYSFYITYAEVDKLGPKDIKGIPLDERSDLDKWIISKLQGLIKYARESFEEYRIHLFMEAFERFLEDLSNWYLRRSRRRFWKSENDTDKLSAFATLYEVLEGLIRIMAPIMPFLTEEIYQNMVKSVSEDAPVSVHLLPYPEYDQAKVDPDLEKKVEIVIKYKNIGLGLRNKANIKVRQPLARLLVKPESKEEEEILNIDWVREQLLEEVNVKTLEILDKIPSTIRQKVSPNFKVMGPKLGGKLRAVQKALETANPDKMEQDLKSRGSVSLSLNDNSNVELVSEDLVFESTGPEDLAFVRENEIFAALDIELSRELKQEGIARDFVRGVQNERKRLDLDVADRIHLYFDGPEEFSLAVQSFTDYISRETLALKVEPDNTLTANENAAMMKIANMAVRIKIARAKTEGR
ncbi:MAG: isoleucine--tRNA ligase [Deltaproteobacteria bacterium]|nr:isoleucine--tRNA ligase [Deltaproteobacteria bacterium]